MKQISVKRQKLSCQSDISGGSIENVIYVFLDREAF